MAQQPPASPASAASPLSAASPAPLLPRSPGSPGSDAASDALSPVLAADAEAGSSRSDPLTQPAARSNNSNNNSSNNNATATTTTTATDKNRRIRFNWHLDWPWLPSRAHSRRLLQQERRRSSVWSFLAHRPSTPSLPALPPVPADAPSSDPLDLAEYYWHSRIDQAIAVRYLQQSAAEGNPAGLYLAGLAFCHGWGGLKRNEKLGVRFFQTAAEIIIDILLHDNALAPVMECEIDDHEAYHHDDDDDDDNAHMHHLDDKQLDLVITNAAISATNRALGKRGSNASHTSNGSRSKHNSFDKSPPGFIISHPDVPGFGHPSDGILNPDIIFVADSSNLPSQSTLNNSQPAIHAASQSASASPSPSPFSLVQQAQQQRQLATARRDAAVDGRVVGTLLALPLLELGIAFLLKWGTPRMSKKLGFDLIRTAAELGDTDAKQQLGFLFLHGIGVRRNRHLAAYWYRAYETASGESLFEGWIWAPPYFCPPVAPRAPKALPPLPAKPGDPAYTRPPVPEKKSKRMSRKAVAAAAAAAEATVVPVRTTRQLVSHAQQLLTTTGIKPIEITCQPVVSVEPAADKNNDDHHGQHDLAVGSDAFLSPAVGRHGSVYAASQLSSQKGKWSFWRRGV